MVPQARPPRDGTAWDLLDSPGLKRLLLVNWLLSMCWDVHSFAVPILGHERGYSASTIGLVLGTNVFLYGGMVMAVMQLRDAICKV